MRALLLLLVLVAPLAGATVPTPARCNAFYCFSLLDSDNDGVPDGILGGTASFLHEAPTASFGLHPEGFHVTADVPVGHEDDDPYYVLPYVGGERNGTSVSVLYVSVEALQLDSDTGRTDTLASVVVRLDDRDGDGIPETPSHSLP